MDFTFYRKREKLADYFKPRKKIMVGYRRFFFGRGFKTNVFSDERLAKEGEVEKIIELLSESARNRNSGVPFALSRELMERLERYDIRVSGIAVEFPKLFPKRCEEAGIRIEKNGYDVLE